VAGLSWFPLTGANVAITASLGIWTAPNAAFKQKPDLEPRAGFKIGF
jgi:hypothetical protein